MTKTAKISPDNAALMAQIEAVHPPDMSAAEWLRAANINSSFFTDLRKGREPSVYKIERLARRAGMRMSDFWRGVELIQFQLQERSGREGRVEDLWARGSKGASAENAAQRKAG